VAAPRTGGRSEIEDEPQGLIDQSHRARRDHPLPGRHAFGRDDPQLIAAGVRGVVEPAVLRLQLDMAAKPVPGGGDRNDDHQPARTVVQDVDGYDNRWPAERRFVADRSAEVDVVDLPAPGQARVSHSARSAKYCCQRSGSSRRRW